MKVVNLTGFTVLFIYRTRLASSEIFSPSNKLHREVGRAKDLSAPRYKRTGRYHQLFLGQGIYWKSLSSAEPNLPCAFFQQILNSEYNKHDLSHRNSKFISQSTSQELNCKKIYVHFWQEIGSDHTVLRDKIGSDHTVLRDKKYEWGENIELKNTETRRRLTTTVRSIPSKWSV